MIRTPQEAPPADVAGLVKPLEWRGREDFWQAQGINQRYEISVMPDRSAAVNIGKRLSAHSTLDAAKAAAQADYEARILSALNLDAALTMQPVTQSDDRTLTGIWPDFIAPSKYAAPDPRWTDPGLPDFRLIWKLAREVGYAVGLHGSMKRDCDLIAAPWTDEAVSAEALIDHLCAGLDAFKLGDGNPAARPHGRLAWAIQQRDGWKKHIDISVMPRWEIPICGMDPEYAARWREALGND